MHESHPVSTAHVVVRWERVTEHAGVLLVATVTPAGYHGPSPALREPRLNVCHRRSARTGNCARTSPPDTETEMPRFSSRRRARAAGRGGAGRASVRSANRDAARTLKLARASPSCREAPSSHRTPWPPATSSRRVTGASNREWIAVNVRRASARRAVASGSSPSVRAVRPSARSPRPLELGCANFAPVNALQRICTSELDIRSPCALARVAPHRARIL
jgi:hypothetical protein